MDNCIKLQHTFTLVCMILYLYQSEVSSFRIKYEPDVSIDASKPGDNWTEPQRPRHHSIPVSILKEISQTKSTKDFVTKFLQPSKHRQHHHHKNKPASAGEATEEYAINEDTVDLLEGVLFTPDGQVSRSGAQTVASFFSPPGQGCQPQTVSMSLPRDPTPNVIYWPECVDVNRCSGCCGSDLLECQAVEVHNKHFTVIKARFDPDTMNFEMIGTEDIPLGEHIACECGCKVKPRHCTPEKQEYIPEACACRCLNEPDSLFCHSYQIWNAQQCMCECSERYTCPLGEEFSNTTCQCVKISENVNWEAIEDTGNGKACGHTVCESGLRAMRIGTQCVCRYLLNEDSTTTDSLNRKRRKHRKNKFFTQ